MDRADDDMSLKEVLMGVSKKLDEFLVQHAQLHTEMLIQSEQMKQMMASHQQWANERAIEFKELEREVKELREWKIETNGQMKLVKWASTGGLVAVGSMLLKLFGVPLP